jgi:hypothetical protein
VTPAYGSNTARRQTKTGSLPQHELIRFSVANFLQHETLRPTGVKITRRATDAVGKLPKYLGGILVRLSDFRSIELGR